MLPAGTRVGPYEIVSWLGAGGMGEVYRARDTTLDREVALKTLPEELARQPERLARLRQEARILASLNDPGIAILHGLEGSRRQMMVVDVSPGIPIRVSRGRRLFEDSYTDVGYDVLPDGQHFVMVEIDQEASRITHFNVILNWFEELKHLVPPK